MRFIKFLKFNLTKMEIKKLLNIIELQKIELDRKDELLDRFKDEVIKLRKKNKDLRELEKLLVSKNK